MAHLTPLSPTVFPLIQAGGFYLLNHMLAQASIGGRPLLEERLLLIFLQFDQNELNETNLTVHFHIPIYRYNVQLTLPVLSMVVGDTMSNYTAVAFSLSFFFPLFKQPV